MNLEKLSDEHLEDYVEKITYKSQAGSYVCPLCKSGEGEHKSGAFGIYPNGKGRLKFNCFKCRKQGDLYDLIGLYENISDKSEQIKRARELYDPSYDPLLFKGSKSSGAVKSSSENEEAADYTELYKKWSEDLDKTDYHRGITLETLKRFNVGYCKNWRHPKAPSNSPASERLIIPTSRSSYLARATDPSIERKYSKQKVGKVKLFNIAALETAKQPIFIVEGELDALSIIDVGGEAIALGSTAYQNMLSSQLSSIRLIQPLIIALDNDESGKTAADELEAKLKALGVKCIVRDIYTGAGYSYKDSNEFLNADRELFKEVIEKTSQEARAMIEQQRTEERAAYRESFSNMAFMDNFRTALNDRERRRFYPTPFSRLNEYLDGGLHEGLTVIGALSSTGKTTFILQLADSLARKGNDVIFFTLEQSREELIAKSISRITYLLDEEPDKRQAKTARGLYREDLSLNERALICEAMNYYEQNISNNLFVSEGVTSRLTVRDVRETVEKHISLTGNNPVVFVDYLQILKPDPDNSNNQDSKQNIDNIVSDLRKIARDYHIPVVCLSSFNRASYNKRADMAAFKESGGIEYSSDLLISLELASIDGRDKPEEIALKLEETKGEVEKDIRLSILKNRSGLRGDINFSFNGMFNIFDEK